MSKIQFLVLISVQVRLIQRWEGGSLGLFEWLSYYIFAQSAGAVEYTDCFSAEG